MAWQSVFARTRRHFFTRTCFLFRPKRSEPNDRSDNKLGGQGIKGSITTLFLEALNKFISKKRRDNGPINEDELFSVPWIILGLVSSTERKKSKIVSARKKRLLRFGRLWLGRPLDRRKSFARVEKLLGWGEIYGIASGTLATSTKEKLTGKNSTGH